MKQKKAGNQETRKKDSAENFLFSWFLGFLLCFSLFLLSFFPDSKKAAAKIRKIFTQPLPDAAVCESTCKRSFAFSA